jgi:hypothetical protein
LRQAPKIQLFAEPVRVRLTPAAENVLEEFARQMQVKGEDATGPPALPPFGG